MTKDRFERKAYRRSPGRQYGYDYDPLRSRRGAPGLTGRADASTPDESWPSRTGSSGRLDTQLAQRPDPRRTRQLLRQHIIAGKARSGALNADDAQEPAEVETAYPRAIAASAQQEEYLKQGDGPPYRVRNRAGHPAQPLLPSSAQRIAEEPHDDEWDDFAFVDPDLGYEDPLDRRLGYTADPSRRLPAPRSANYLRRPADDAAYQDEDDEAEYEDDYDDSTEEWEPPYKPRRRGKKRGLTRRKLLVGLGIAAAGGVAAYELGPRIPQAVSEVGTNLEHQLQDAYNKGLTAGANAVRKEFISGLNNLEGYSLGAAINVARLTRVAYDAFVSPIITLAATITGDFLSVTLQALQSARGFLSKFNQDNDTLNALQTVLETWTKQVHNVPQEWQTITDTDLDGAQGYLRALQRKIQDEQAKLNSNAPPPTPTARPTQTPRTH